MQSHLKFSPLHSLSNRMADSETVSDLEYDSEFFRGDTVLEQLIVVLLL